jgi:hypothetical protein
MSADTKMMPTAAIENRPFGFIHEGKIYDTNPTKAEIQEAIDRKELEARSIQGDRAALDAEWFAQSNGNVEKIAQLQKKYNARRIAYLHENNWPDPIRAEANGKMHDGTHRLRAAIHRGDKTILVAIEPTVSK